MDRSLVLRLIAAGLAAYGIYTALYIPAMLIGPPAPLLLGCFLLQVVTALVAAVGVWQRLAWAPLAVVLLGASIAATRLVEAFVLWIVPYLPALLIAAAILVGALLAAAYVRRR
jgi:hypothetical protein